MELNIFLVFVWDERKEGEMEKENKGGSLLGRMRGKEKRLYIC